MSPHVSIFDIKRFAEERLGFDELPAFEDHLSACTVCAGRLQVASTRELRARGLEAFLSPAPAKFPSFLTGMIAAAACVAFFISGAPAPFRASQEASASDSEIHGSNPITPAPADGGMLNGGIAFYDGGDRTQ